MASEIKVDTISEKTSANGVAIDSVVHKDSAIYPSSADGGALGSASNEWSDLFLADSSVIKFGNDQDTTLTHTDGTGLTLNSTNKLCFQDTGTYVGSNADGDIDVVSDGTAVDSINLESAGGVTLDAGSTTHGITYEDDGTAMLRITNSSSDVVIKPLVDAKDIIFQQYDGTEVARIEDNATFNVSSAGKFAYAGTAVTATAAEMNLLDGGTSVGSSITIADADGVIVNDGGSMKTIPASDFKTFAGGKILQVVTNAVADTSADTISSGSWEAVGSISVALTPATSSSRINVSASVHYEMGAINQGFCLNIYRDIGGGGYAQIRDINSFRISNSSYTDQQRLGFWSYSTTFSPSTTSAVTFKLYGITGGSADINLKTLDLTAMEIGA